MTVSINGNGTVAGVTSQAGVAINPPVLQVYRNTNQTGFSEANYGKVQLNAKAFDSLNAFDATTNFRYQPTVAGYYWFGWVVNVPTSTAGYTAVASLYKNGAVAGSGSSAVGVASNYMISSGSTMVYLNGTTDYVELWLYVATSNTANTAAGDTPQRTVLNGYFVRA